ncbi:UPF0280 family protein [Elioraea rosea]|uniref:UPF0280 family protein n=1 Tax=Elioraea rosea TaxID=2492390 RepID=UPI001184DC7A|nr:UPF0280 family protein [Elioraea rosea]
MSAVAALLPGGRLHLQHGPIDAIVQAWGEEAEVREAYAQAARAFPAILPALCAELTLLRTPLPAPMPHGAVARRMHAATVPYAERFITPMAAVAGAVADALLAALMAGRTLSRALVNDGGDIALHLAPGQGFRCGIVADLAAPQLDIGGLDAIAAIGAGDGIGGIATSGWRCKGKGGRSFSFGIADAVTVLADSAAAADAAATVIANAVDLRGHPAIARRPASEIDPDSDLGDRLVTWDVGPLTPGEIDAALEAGARVAQHCARRGLIRAAVLHLRAQRSIIGAGPLALAA